MKRSVLLLAAVLWAGCAGAQVGPSFPGPGMAHSTGGGSGMKFPILSFGSSQATIVNTGNNYGYLFGSTSNGVNWSTSATGDKNQGSVIAVPGTISQLTAKIPGAITTGSWNLALFKNSQTPAALTCNIGVGFDPNVCSDAVNSVSVAAGDYVGWKLTPTSTPTTIPLIQIGAVFTSTNANEALIVAQSSGNLSTTATSYVGFGAAMSAVTTLVNIETVVPTSGTIDQLNVLPNQAVGSSGFWVTVYKNEAPTTLQCRITTAGPCTELTQTVTLAAGDRIGLEFCPGMVAAPTSGCTPGTAPTGGIIHAAVRWVPTTAGEYPVMASSPSGQPSPTQANYFGISGGGVNSITAEANTYNIAPIGFTFSKLYLSLLTAPGGTTSRIVTLRDAAASTALTTTITGAATTNTDTTHTVSVANGDLLDWMASNGGGTPATTFGWRASAVVTVP